MHKNKTNKQQVKQSMDWRSLLNMIFVSVSWLCILLLSLDLREDSVLLLIPLPCFIPTEQRDTTPPSILTPCPNDTVILVPPGTRQSSATWTEPTFTDLVDGNDLYITRSKVPGSNFREGSTQVLYVAMDKSYNSVQCSFTVTVNSESHRNLGGRGMFNLHNTSITNSI